MFTTPYEIGEWDVDIINSGPWRKRIHCHYTPPILRYVSLNNLLPFILG